MKVVASMNSDTAKLRSKNAERQARWREKHKPKSGTDVTDNVTSNVTDNVTAVTQRCVDINTTTLQTTDKPKPSSSTQSRHERRVTRGTRWPDDFVPKPATLQHALNGGMSEDEYWEEFTQTRDYYLQLPGQKAISLNWQLTWLNRIKYVLRTRYKNGRTQATGRVASISERFARIREEIDATGPGQAGHDSGGENLALLPGLRQSA